MSVDFGYEASTNGSGDQERLGKIRIPAAPGVGRRRSRGRGPSCSSARRSPAG